MRLSGAGSRVLARLERAADSREYRLIEVDRKSSTYPQNDANGPKPTSFGHGEVSAPGVKADVLLGLPRGRGSYGSLVRLDQRRQKNLCCNAAVGSAVLTVNG